MPTFQERPSLILASNSPRRRELLALGAWAFRVQVADIDERVLPAESASDYVLRLARTKAQVVARTLSGGEMVLAADTAVVDAGQILGKPQDSVHAVGMLRQLRGHTHQVVTALAVLSVSDGAMRTDVCTTDVPMRNYTDEEVAVYVSSGDPLDKAGAYAIQNRDFHPVEAFSGCFASVMGLPLCHLTRLLRHWDLAFSVDVPLVCQEALAYACDVHPLILG